MKIKIKGEAKHEWGGVMKMKIKIKGEAKQMLEAFASTYDISREEALSRAIGLLGLVSERAGKQELCFVERTSTGVMVESLRHLTKET